MPEIGLDPLRASVLWFGVRRMSGTGRSGREYAVMNDAGAVLLVAHAYRWGRELLVSLPGGEPAFTILRSRLFPLTGRALVKELPAASGLGIVTRNGSFRDARGTLRGRFVDARSFRERAREGVLHATLDALLANSEASGPSGPDAFVLQMDGAVAGTLMYSKLPFAADPKPDPAPATVRRVIPAFLARAWSSLNAARGWKFARSVETQDDPRLPLAAALFTAELSRW